MMSPAAKRFKTTAFIVLGCYFPIFIGTMFAVDHNHPTGALLYAYAALPTLPLVTVFALMGRYLKVEKDEYKRDLVVRCLLWGAGASMGMNIFCSFLRLFGWKAQAMPFTELYVFAIAMLLAKLTYRMANPVPSDDVALNGLHN